MKSSPQTHMPRFTMKETGRAVTLSLATSLLLVVFPASTWVNAQRDQRAQFDLQGDTHFSRYNFTDIKIPYDGVDSWAELKAAYWLNDTRTVSPYLSVIPTLTSVSEFWWQKNLQLAAGVQWYPVTASIPFLRSIRAFALTAWRTYLDQPSGTEQEDADIRIGADYYYDNLHEDSRFIGMAWSNADFRKTNFSLDNYDAFLWTGNIKAGFKLLRSSSILLGYLVSEWTYVPKYGERWWENFVCVGPGIRFYPKSTEGDSPSARLLRRFHVYVEVLKNIVWLGNEPDAGKIKEADLRIGLGLSTCGFFRHKK